MARISKGILGGFSGKVGTVVGAVWRGQDIIRSIPKPSSRPASDKQLAQQMKFKLVITFLQPLKNIQTRYFGSGSGSKSRINLAVSYTIGEAVEIMNDEAVLIFSKVLITKGDLAGFQNGLATAEAAQKVKFTWEDNSAQGNANAKDVANAVIFVPESGLFEIYENIGERDDLTATVTLPTYCAGLDVEAYVYFRNEAETLACNSSYLGTVTVL
ncbi:hypothetical protein ASG01_14760 [Chryseobacterium sp. Leaf180]|uniref:DUF6266 family protein n=1 Tax=Chryseobacterium sp. Leaf180 TaxID=1736289 RepID=UPI0006FA48C7|nr:DUF6266 family protein [Chryseobacterium sp. Leaf180]KQR90823.1 hypothetical protein ASG01_14760 [Chryseobacterium sp. Leaf180]